MEKSYCDRFKNMDGAQISLTDNSVSIISPSDCLTSKLVLIEKDVFTVTWKGQFSDGMEFRIVGTNPAMAKLLGDSYSFASMLHDGYAVHFNII